MTVRPPVAVVLPVFNRAACVERAVRSVLAQTWRPLELIVVDDGSTDATPEILERLRAEHAAAYAGDALDFRILRQENRGVSAARNRAIRESAALFVALLDSDDEWLPEKTARQMAQLAERPETPLNQCEERWIRRGVRVNPPKHHEKREGDLFAASLRNCVVSPSAALMRRALFDEFGLFDEEMPACEDYDLWLRVAKDRPVGLVREVLLIKYGGHADQLSRSVAALDRWRIRALCKLLDAGGLTAPQRAEALNVLAAKCRVYGRGCAKRGRLEEAAFIERLARRYGAPEKE